MISFRRKILRMWVSVVYSNLYKHADDPHLMRQKYRTFMTFIRKLSFNEKTFSQVGYIPLNNRSRAIVISPPNSRSEVPIVYAHGGGFIVGSFDTHLAFMKKLAADCGRDVICLPQLAAPKSDLVEIENHYMSSIESLIKAQNYRKIFLCGDSSGGYLGLSALLKRSFISERVLSALFFSPWINFRRDFSNDLKRGIGTSEGLVEVSKKYIQRGQNDFKLPNLLNKDPIGLPPIKFLASKDEVFLEDLQAFHDKIKKVGVETDLEIWSRMLHAWPVYVDGSKELHATLRAVNDFFNLSEANLKDSGSADQSSYTTNLAS